jgi:hypothetical protein
VSRSVRGCLHGVVVQVGVFERETRGVCQASPSGGEGDEQTPWQTCRRAWASRGFSGLFTELLGVGTGEGFGLRLGLRLGLGGQLRRFR